MWLSAISLAPRPAPWRYWVSRQRRTPSTPVRVAARAPPVIWRCTHWLCSRMRRSWWREISQGSAVRRAIISGALMPMAPWTLLSLRGETVGRLPWRCRETARSSWAAGLELWVDKCAAALAGSITMAQGTWASTRQPAAELATPEFTPWHRRRTGRLSWEATSECWVAGRARTSVGLIRTELLTPLSTLAPTISFTVLFYSRSAEFCLEAHSPPCVARRAAGLPG